jgi:hypothetical protein
MQSTARTTQLAPMHNCRERGVIYLRVSSSRQGGYRLRRGRLLYPRPARRVPSQV